MRHFTRGQVEDFVRNIHEVTPNALEVTRVEVAFFNDVSLALWLVTYDIIHLKNELGEFRTHFHELITEVQFVDGEWVLCPYVSSEVPAGFATPTEEDLVIESRRVEKLLKAQEWSAKAKAVQS